MPYCIYGRCGEITEMRPSRRRSSALSHASAHRVSLQDGNHRQAARHIVPHSPRQVISTPSPCLRLRPTASAPPPPPHPTYAIPNMPPSHPIPSYPILSHPTPPHPSSFPTRTIRYMLLCSLFIVLVAVQSRILNWFVKWRVGVGTLARVDGWCFALFSIFWLSLQGWYFGLMRRLSSGLVIRDSRAAEILQDQQAASHSHGFNRRVTRRSRTRSAASVSAGDTCASGPSNDAWTMAVKAAVTASSGTPRKKGARMHLRARRTMVASGSSPIQRESRESCARVSQSSGAAAAGCQRV